MSFFNRVWAAVRPVVQFRVQRWHMAMRGWGDSDIRVLVCCEDDIWYWRLAEFIGWDCCTRVCDWLHHVPLPKWLRNWERAWGAPEPCKFEQWYGDDFSVFWHCWVESPVCQWAWKHKNRHVVEFELTLDEARVKFVHDPEKYQWVERELAQHKEWDAEKEAEEKAQKDSQNSSTSGIICT